MPVPPVRLSVSAVVTLQQGDGSQGKDVSGELVATTYAVCEVPVADPSNGGQPVDLDALPRPDATSVGSNQTVDPRYPLRITVELTGSGQSELQFRDTRAAKPQLATRMLARALDAGIPAGKGRRDRKTPDELDQSPLEPPSQVPARSPASPLDVAAWRSSCVISAGPICLS